MDWRMEQCRQILLELKEKDVHKIFAAPLPDNPVHRAARDMLTIFHSRFGTMDKEFEAAKKNKKPTKASTTLVDAPMYLEDETHADDPYDSDYGYGESAKPKKKKTKKETQAQPVQVQVAAQPLSFEEQEALSDAINELPERLLLGAMQIIREAVVVNDDDEEIDLDIDQLDSRTQRSLQKFVMEVR